MSDEIVIINFLTTIENINSIPVPESNQEYLSEFLGKKVLITVRKRNVKEIAIDDEKPEDNE
jgi:selenophosphate synthetase-related protein